jgi:hypothetical protein
MNEITPLSIRKQIAHLKRIHCDIEYRYLLAWIGKDKNELTKLSDQYLQLTRRIQQLEQRYAELIAFQNLQAAAVTEAERIINANL